MLYNEFMWLDFCEFNCIYDAWLNLQEEQYKGEWERAREIAYLVTQPHLSKRIKPEDLIRFSWDSKKHPQEERSKLSKKEAFERFQGLMSSRCQKSKKG